MRYSGNPACVEARESVSDDPLEKERIGLHRTRCADCREHAGREDEIRRSIDLLTRPLDDVSRARIQSRLAAEFDRMAAINARGKRSNLRWVAIAAAAAMLLLYLWPREMVEPLPSEERLIPFLVAGTSEAKLAPTGVIEAAEGMTIRAEIEGKGDLTLVGPGRARMHSFGELSLESGLLLVHVNGPFAVHAGEMTVRVAGTRFAVDRRDPSSVRVSVSEGAVDVEREGSIARVARGEAWPREALVEERLARTELSPPRDPSGVVVIGGTPVGAVAVLDGVALGPTPLIARLSAGDHELEVQADLHTSHRRTIAVPEGGVIDVSFALDRARTESPPPRPHRVKPVTPVVEMEPETAETLYRRAEEALAADRRAEAQALLEDLARRYAGDPLVESALYELARIDHAEGRLEEAHGRLIRLLERRQDAALAESGQRLLCQIDVETRRYDDANACWRSFRERFPGSVHDAEALASLIALAQIWNDCARVKALGEEFLAAHPEHALQGDVEARLRRCR